MYPWKKFSHKCTNRLLELWNQNNFSFYYSMVKSAFQSLNLLQIIKFNIPLGISENELV